MTARLSHPSKTPVTFHYRTADQTAAAGMDYVAASGTVTMPAGRTSQTLDFTILGDGEAEADERFDVFIDSVSGATYDAFASTAFGTIRDDDLPAFKVEESTVYEGDGATRELCFTATLARSTAAPVTVIYLTENSSATAPSDFVSESGSFTIPPGQKSWPVCITIVGDTVPEPDEQFKLQVGTVSGAVYDAGASRPFGRIRNDDGPPVLTIQGSSAYEGATGTRGLRFGATLSHAATTSLQYAFIAENDPTAAHPATEESDFDDSMNAFVFAPGNTYREFFITVYGDTEPEVDEVFKVKVAPMGSGGHTYDGSASDPYGHILDDDDVVMFRIVSSERFEGNAGSSEASFEVALSHPVPRPVVIDYATADDTATAGSDYVAESRTITIPAGSLRRAFTVTTHGDATVEPDERFRVQVTGLPGGTAYDPAGSDPYGTILNDDAALSVADVTVTEGASSASLTVSLAPALRTRAMVHYATADLGATAPADFTATSGDLVFAVGATSKTVTVPIVNDAIDEPDEAFSLVLSRPSVATIADGTGVATIIDDDGTPPTTPPDSAAHNATASASRLIPPHPRSPLLRPTWLRGAIGSARRPSSSLVSFSASDPSGLASTALQHRSGSGAFTGVTLASGSATSAVVPVGTSSRTSHQFQARATDGAGNTSPFATGPAFRVKVLQDGTSAIKAKGSWAARDSRSAFGGSVRQAAKAGASQAISLTASDLAIVSTMGPDRGKAKVVLDGKAVASLDLYSRTSRAKQVIWSVSFPAAGKHTIALVALGTKNAKAKGTRVDLDAFLALTP